MDSTGQALLGSVELEWAALTEGGPYRDENQDAVLALPGCFSVADGMGGYEGGALASATTLAAIDSVFDRLAAPGSVPTLTERDVNDALTFAAASISTVADGRPMGSTVTGAALCSDEFGPHWLVWHVGDSRLYRFFRGRVSQVTVDHTVVNELVLMGQLPAQEIPHHPDRHVITRAVGMADSLPADFATLEVREGEVLLLCSDGLTGTADDRLIEAVLKTIDDLPTCALRLVELAYETGGRDNTSVLLVRCIAAPDADATQGGASDLEVTRPRVPAAGVGSGSVVLGEGADRPDLVIKEVPG